MTILTWRTATTGDWATAADWSPAQVPGSGDTAEIGPGLSASAAWTVTASDETVASVSLDAGSFATLSVGTLLATTGAVVVNSGTLDLQQGATLAAVGGLTLNAGSELDVRIGTIDGNVVDAGHLDIAIPSGAVSIGTLTVTGNFTLSSTLSLGANAVLDVGGTLTLTGGSVTLSDGAEVTGTLAVAGASTIDLLAGSVWTIGVLIIGANTSPGSSLAPGALSVEALGGGSVAIAGAIVLGSDPGPAASNLGTPGAGTLSMVEVAISAASLSLLDGSLISSFYGSLVLGTATAQSDAIAIGADATLRADAATIQTDIVDDGTLLDGPLLTAGGGADPGMLTISGSLTGNGTLAVLNSDSLGDVAAGTVEIANAQGFAGTIALMAGTTLILDSGNLSPAMLALHANPTLGGATVDIAALPYSASNQAVYNSSSGLLVVGGDILNVGLGYVQGDFGTGADLQGGTDVYSIPCYVSGTRIATPGGEVPVEALRAGDSVLTLSSPGLTAQTVRWAGRFGVDLDRHPMRERAAPIRIRAHAFADGVPARDLLLSPDHSVLIDGVLMQAQSLVNGATIVREPAVGRVIYWHVELERHGILLAEGLPAESYLDTGNRAAFAGEPGVRPLFLNLSKRSWAADACAKLVLTGPDVHAARARLLARTAALGWTSSDDPDLQVLADGVATAPCHDGQQRWHVRLPAGTREVRLRSRWFVPSTLDPTSDDCRRLGVAVAALHLGTAELTYGAGWHAPEAGWRWTDGDATLQLDGLGRAAWLHVAAVAVGARYWIEPVRPARPRDAERRSAI